MRISTLSRYCALVLSLGSVSAQANNLLDVYQLALENDPTIISSEYQRRATERGLDVAKTARMPTVNASLSGGRSGTHNASVSGHSDDRTTALQATLPLYNRGDQINITGARVQLDKAEAEHANMRQDMIRRTAEAYFGVLRATDNVAFAEAEREAIFRQLDQAERRYDVGLVAITDVKEAQASYDSAVANVIAAENQLHAAHEGLRVMTNTYVEDLHVVKADVSMLAPEPNNVDQWVETAKELSPTIAAAQYDLRSAELNMRKATASRYPTLDLVGSYANTEGDSDAENHSIELELKVPLYTGGAVTASKRQAHELAKASDRMLALTERNVERNVRTAFSTVTARISQVKALKRALESNEVRLEATEAGYDAGTRTAVDVLNAIRGTSSAGAQYAGARYDYILAMLDLQAAVGLLGEADINKFNQWLEPAATVAKK